MEEYNKAIPCEILIYILEDCEFADLLTARLINKDFYDAVCILVKSITSECILSPARRLESDKNQLLLCRALKEIPADFEFGERIQKALNSYEFNYNTFCLIKAKDTLWCQSFITRKIQIVRDNFHSLYDIGICISNCDLKEPENIFFQLFIFEHESKKKIEFITICEDVAQDEIKFMFADCIEEIIWKYNHHHFDNGFLEFSINIKNLLVGKFFLETDLLELIKKKLFK